MTNAPDGLPDLSDAAQARMKALKALGGAYHVMPGGGAKPGAQPPALQGRKPGAKP